MNYFILFACILIAAGSSGAADVVLTSVVVDVASIDETSGELLSSPVRGYQSGTGDAQISSAVMHIHLKNGQAAQDGEGEVHPQHCDIVGKRVKFTGYYRDDQTFMADSMSMVPGNIDRDKTGVRSRLTRQTGHCGFQ